MGTPSKRVGSSDSSTKTKTTTTITKSANNFTKAEQGIIKLRIIELLQTNHTMPQVRVIIRRETGKSKNQVNRYIAAAEVKFLKNIDRDIGTKRLEMITSLRKDIDIAFARFQENDSLKWFHAYQAVKAKLISLEPRELKASEEALAAPVTSYTFTFNEIKGKQDGHTAEAKEDKE